MRLRESRGNQDKKWRLNGFRGYTDYVYIQMTNNNRS